MRKVMITLGLLLLLPLTGKAQEVAAMELYGSYSHLRIEEIPHHGWNLTFGPNLNNNLGLMVELSGHYGSITERVFGADIKTESRIHSVLMGPRMFETVSDKWTPYAQALLGVNHVDVVAKGTIPGTTTTASVSDGDIGLGLALGGGLDMKINDAFALRIFQADYYIVRVGGFKSEGGRITAGIVFRFGQR